MGHTAKRLREFPAAIDDELPSSPQSARLRTAIAIPTVRKRCQRGAAARVYSGQSGPGIPETNERLVTSLFSMLGLSLKRSLDGYKSNQPFQDPAIMSASFGPPQPRDMSYNSMAYGPPPGLGMVSHQQMGAHSNGMPTALAESNPNGEQLSLNYLGREVCVPSAALSVRNVFYRH